MPSLVGSEMCIRDRPRVVQNAQQVYPIRSRARAELPRTPKTVVALVPNVGSVGKHRAAVAAKPFCARNAAVSVRPRVARRCSEKIPVVRHQFASGGTGGWVGGADSECRPEAQYLVAKKLDVHFPLPVRSGKTRPVRLVHHRDDPTSTANRWVSGGLLQFESLKRSRNVVLGNVVRGGFLGEVVEHVLRQLRWKILRHVAMVCLLYTSPSPRD